MIRQITILLNLINKIFILTKNNQIKTMKKITYLLTICFSLSLLTSCTENLRAKSYGGSMTIELPKGTKVTNITWKKGDLWYSYRPMRENEKPENTIFVEQSMFGLMEGEVTFVESK